MYTDMKCMANEEAMGEYGFVLYLISQNMIIYNIKI
jgi:hypothetical protein